MRAVVIGGGPAGMMAAAQAAANGHDTVLFEGSEKLGKKIYITGKGRGNVTNAAELSDFFDVIGRNPSFLYSALYGFTNDDTVALLESHGVRTKVERGSRVFPASDHASDITKALAALLRENDVEVRLNSKIKRIETCDDGQMRVSAVVTESGERIEADAVAIATGGLSYPTTGSTGDGLRFAKELDIAVKQPVPGLVPLTVKESFVKELQGLSLKNVSLRISDSKRVLTEGFGEMLFTHFGISGPLVLTASSQLSERLNGGADRTLAASVDLKPALDAKKLDARLQRICAEEAKKQFSHFYASLLPKKLEPVMVGVTGIDPKKRIGDLNKAERQRIGEKLKAFSFTITGTRGFNEAIITRGGIDVREIDPSTMESKKIKGLFFAGEVIDVDGPTGGFNMQIALSTGALAGRSI